MTGGTLRHNATVNDLAGRLESLLTATPCRIFRENVRLLTKTSSRYPDIVVSCDAIDLDRDLLDDAHLIVEVVSPSTEQIDRTEKPAEYRALPSLRAYLIVDQQGTVIEAYARNDYMAPWIRSTGAITVELHGVQCELF